MELNLNQIIILAYVDGLKAVARKEYLEQHHNIQYSLENPDLQDLVGKKFLSVSKSGAITPDKTKIRAELSTHKHPDVSMPGINSHWAFKPNR
jgi:hypothetical protein